MVGFRSRLISTPPDQSKLIHIIHQPGNKNSISHNTITGLLVDADDNLIVSTNVGLNRLISKSNTEAKFEIIELKKNNTFQEEWSNLLQDKQKRLWSTAYIINDSTGQMRVLSTAEGVDISSWRNSFTKTQNGTLLHGGINGLLMIKPEQFKEWQYQPPTVATQLKIDSEIYPLTKLEALFLEPKTKSFSVEFSTLDYSAPTLNRYAYQLEAMTKIGLILTRIIELLLIPTSTQVITH